MMYGFVLFSGTTGDLVTNPRAYSVGCRPPSLLTGSSSSVSTTGSGSSHHHSRHKSRFIDIPGATTASGTSGTGTGSQASSFRCVSRVVRYPVTFWQNQSYVIKSAPWTILWFRIFGIFSVEYIKRLCVFMFQTCFNSQLLRRVL